MTLTVADWRRQYRLSGTGEVCAEKVEADRGAAITQTPGTDLSRVIFSQPWYSQPWGFLALEAPERRCPWESPDRESLA